MWFYSQGDQIILFHRLQSFYFIVLNSISYGNYGMLFHLKELAMPSSAFIDSTLYLCIMYYVHMYVYFIFNPKVRVSREGKLTNMATHKLVKYSINHWMLQKK